MTMIAMRRHVVTTLALATLTASGCTGALGPYIPTIAGTWALEMHQRCAPPL